MKVRHAAAAGTFYPGDPEALAAVVDRSIGQSPRSLRAPKALIAPHAAYASSGAVAGSAYALLGPLRDVVRRVVLLGPSHRDAPVGFALSSAGAFETPLGLVEVDADACRAVLGLPHVGIDDAAHRLEHSLEVQLPFLQRTLARFRIVPLVVGAAGSAEIAGVLDRLWDGAETLLVVSADLSHDHDPVKVQRRDRRTAAAIAATAVDSIADDDACGAGPLRGLLEAARRHGIAPRLLDLRVSGPAERVVGLAAFALA